MSNEQVTGSGTDGCLPIVGFSVPLVKSVFYICGRNAAQNGGLTFQLPHPAPNRFHRIMQKLVFGFEWESVE